VKKLVMALEYMEVQKSFQKHQARLEEDLKCSKREYGLHIGCRVRGIRVLVGRKNEMERWWGRTADFAKRMRFRLTPNLLITNSA